MNYETNGGAILIVLLVVVVALIIYFAETSKDKSDPNKKKKPGAWRKNVYRGASVPIGYLDGLMKSDSTDFVPEPQKKFLINKIHDEINKAYYFNDKTGVIAVINDLLYDLRSKQKSVDMGIMSTEIDEMEALKNTVFIQRDLVKERVSEFILERDIRYSTINRLNEKIEERMKALNEALKAIYNTLCFMNEQMDDVVRSYDDFLVGHEFGGGDADSYTAVIDQVKEQVKEVNGIVSSIVGGVKEVLS